MQAAIPLVAATGLAFEARIASGPGVVVVCSGDRRNFVDDMKRAAAAGCRGIISFGIAGGLLAELKPGAWVVASAVIAEGERLQADVLWSQLILKAHPGAVHGAIVGVETPVAEPSAKRRLRAKTGAVAVDMESHIAARIATEHGIPFAAVRVVADPVHRRLPPAALGVVTADGTPDIRAVLRSVARAPIQIPGLINVALDTRRARGALLSSRRLLGALFGLPEVREHLLDVT